MPRDLHAVTLLAVCILTSSAMAEPANDEAAGFVSIHNIAGKMADFANPDTWQKAPTYETDQSPGRFPTRVVALKNLCSSCGDCHKAQDEGTVAKRDFDGGGLLIKGFVLEHKDGSREYVNVSVDNDILDISSPSFIGLVDSGWIELGLQTLLREGRKVKLNVTICGNGGVVSVDEIR
jgi:hypothetical protein